MKTVLLIGLLTLSAGWLQAEKLVPSTLDPARTEARDRAFIPWSAPKEASAYWKDLSPTHVPILNQRREGESRDIYIPNPGTGYWVLGGLSEKELFRVHRDKLKIGDTLISASIYQDGNGEKFYWALWAPQDRAKRLTVPMEKLGIGQARIEYSFTDRFWAWAQTLKPFSGMITWVSLGLNAFLILVALILVFLLGRSRVNWH